MAGIEKREVRLFFSELCYYLFFGILFGAKAVGLYDGQAVFRIFLVIASFFGAVKVILTAYDMRELVGGGALILLGLIVYRNSGEKSALVFLMMMIGFKNISMERLMKTGLVVWGSGFGVQILRSMMKTGNEFVMADKQFGMEILRRGLGYTHPNVLHISYGILAVMVLLCAENRDKRKESYLWLFSGNFVVYLYSASNTGFMLVLLFLIFNAAFEHRKRFGKVETLLINMVYPVCLLFSLLFPLLVDPDSRLANMMNRILNNRFYASRLYMQENPATFFGRRIYASHTYALDNSYVTLYIFGGLVLFLLISAAYMLVIHLSLKQKDGESLSLLLPFAIAGVIEPFLFNLSFKNLSFLVIAKYIFSFSGENRVKLLSEWDREIIIHMPLLFGGYYEKREDNEQARKNRKKKEVISALVLGMTGGACCLIFIKTPETIFVGEKNNFIEDSTVMMVDDTEYAEDEKVIFYQYDASTKKVCQFQGAMIKFNLVRDAISICFLITWIVYMILEKVSLFRGNNFRRGTQDGYS